MIRAIGRPLTPAPPRKFQWVIQPAWWVTMVLRFIDPARMMTVTITKPMETS